MGIFAQDQWTVKRLTLNYGVRIDFLKAIGRSAGHRGRSVHAGAQLRRHRQRAELEGHRSARSASPTTCSATARRRIKAQHRPLRRRRRLHDRPRRRTRCSRRSTSTTRTWTSDPSGTAQSVSRLQPARTRAGATASLRRDRATRRSARRSRRRRPTIRRSCSGWGVRPYNWEVQISIQQQVAPRVSVYAGYSRRWFGNLYGDAEHAPSPTPATRRTASRFRRRRRSRAAAAERAAASSAATST